MCGFPMMSLLPFFQWCENTELVATLREIRWLVPTIEAVHAMGFAVLGGAVLVVNLRLLGFGLRQQPVARVARDTERWLLISLLVIVPTGVVLFMTEAIKCYFYLAFWVKMTAFFLALVFTFTVHRSVAMADGAQASPRVSKAVAWVSLSLWSGVGIAGRLIGFS
jgi:hypothetical protein